MQEIINNALITLQNLKKIQAKLEDSLSHQTVLKNDTAIANLTKNISDVTMIMDSIESLQQDVQDAIQSKRRVFPDDINNLKSEINRGNIFAETLSSDLLSIENDNTQASRYIAAGEIVLRELEKLENRTPNKKPTITLETQCNNITNNLLLKDTSKVFLIELLSEVFNGKETLTSSELKESLTKVVFEKSHHIVGFEMNVDSQQQDESLATEISEDPKPVVPSAFAKIIDSENRLESEASGISKDSEDEKNAEESNDDDSYII